VIGFRKSKLSRVNSGKKPSTIVDNVNDHSLGKTMVYNIFD